MYTKGPSMLSFVFLLVLTFLVGHTRQNSRQKRQILPDQPRILTQNGHLVFQSGTNHNITFRSGSGGGIFIDNIDLKSTATLAKANKDAIDQMQGSSGNVPQSSVLQRLTAVENQVQQMASLPNTVASLDSRFNDYTRQNHLASISVNSRLSALAVQINNGNSGSSQTLGTLTQLQHQMTTLTSTVNRLETEARQRQSTLNQLTSRMIMIRRGYRRNQRRMRTLRDSTTEMRDLLTQNECASNPCMNGATCTDLFNGFLCRCPPNYKGPRCSQDVNECHDYAGTDLGCQNGARCINTPGGFRCECTNNWHGIHCSERHDDCTGASHTELCGHGTCVNEPRVLAGQPKYRCICDVGWVKDASNISCTVDFNECSTGRHCSVDPPVVCFNLPGSFVCGSCPAGYTGNGHVCTDINECLVNNGGCSTNPHVQCLNTRGSSVCGSCPSGYSTDGRLCVPIDSGTCSSNNGNCHPRAICRAQAPLSERCICPIGFVGHGFGPTGCRPVSSNLTLCQSQPCINGGTCTMTSPSSFRCDCHPRTQGQYCELPVDSCLSNPCQNGGRCFNDPVTFYRCECPAGFEGTHCELQADDCVGNYNTEFGNIRFPLSDGTSYPHNVRCVWVITTALNKLVRLRFTSFELEDSAGEGNCYDYLNINDGPSIEAPQIGHYCSSELPNGGVVNSTGNSIFLLFVSDGSIAHSGFELHWDSLERGSECGGALEGSNTGTINSPGYPNNYPHNADCVWTISVTPGNVIEFTFSNLAMEEHSTCAFDYLEIRDGLTSDSNLLNSYCTSTTPPPLRTSSSNAYIHFHSDGSVSDSGFHITYNTPTGPNGGQVGCGGEFNASSGELTSPGFPDEYANSLDCTWRINVPDGRNVILTFAHFNLEHNMDCSYDYMTVTDGNNSPLGTFCGDNLPATINSITNSITVKLVTDSSVTNNGFAASWTAGCNRMITANNQELASPNYPRSYPPSLDCQYTITAEEGQVVVFHVTLFDVGVSSQMESCDGDYLEFYDGAMNPSTLVGRYCNGPHTPHIRSTGRTLTIRFVSDSSDDGNTGFRGFSNFVTGSPVCGGQLSDANGFINSPGYPESYLSATNCTWYITAEAGMIINFRFSSLILLGRMSNGCTEYVDVFDGPDTQSDLIGRYCGTIEPAMISSTDNAMTIFMHTQPSIRVRAFSASYTTINASHACGGVYTEDVGVITSPGYPDTYPHGRDCIWIIRGSANFQVSLTFTHFNLEYSSICNYDFVEIRDGGTADAPMRRPRLCGNLRSIQPFFSSGNAVYIHFHSDSGLSEGGFRLEYSTLSSGCGADFTAPYGTIVSPNYPNPYQHRAYCTWTITLSMGSRISLNFQDFDIEYHPNCNYDSLMIKDGNAAGPSLAVQGNTTTYRMCGSTNPGTIVSTTNKVWIRLRSDSSITGRGFVINYTTNCTNTLTALRGVIESPYYPHNYPHLGNCTWIIQAPNSNKINVTFAAFELETSAVQCSFDHLQIRDGAHFDSPLLYDLCGLTIPAPFQSPRNFLHLNFKTDFSVNAGGFRLEYVFDGCGGIIDENSGTLQSPNYPEPYTQSLTCLWLITVDLGKSIELTIYDLDLENSPGCRFDSLKVFAGLDDTGPSIYRACHTQSRHTVSSNGNTMYVKFTSDASIQGRGFNASFTAKDGGCGGNFTARQGSIMSPGYPASYPTQGVCEWLITVMPTSVVRANVTDLSLWPYDGFCHSISDTLEVYDGANDSMPILTTLCGNLDFGPSLINSTSYQMFVKLTIIEERVGSYEKNGFNLNYITACGGQIILDGNDKTITSPHYPDTAPVGSSCQWIITSTNNAAIISFTFTHMAISNYRANCEDAYVSVYNVEDQNVPRYCGSSIPSIIYSGGSTLMVNYTAGYPQNQFRAVVSTSTSACGGEMIGSHGRFNSPNFPDNYPNDLQCVWQLRVSPGNSIQLSFSQFSLRSFTITNTDYLEIRAPDVNGRLVGRYLDRNAPSNLTLSDGAWIKFRSNEFSTSTGFQAEWTLYFGGDFTGDSGQVASPNYPNKYESNAHVRWNIMVDPDKVVKITFVDFTLEQMHSSCLDYLQIYDGTSETGNLLETYCGRVIPATLYTTTNVATLVFESDFSFELTGFLINWTAVANSEITQPTDNSGPSGCGGDLIVTDLEQTLTSPGNLTGYENQLDCTWNLIVPQGRSVVTNITYIDLETHGACYYDYIVFSDAFGTTSSRFCGRNRNDEPIRIRGLGRVQFHTDSSVTRTGFQLTYKLDCGGVFTTSTAATIMSPNFPNVYPINANCTWLVQVRVGKTISLDFNSTFNIADTGTCDNDYLQILNGVGEDSPPLYINTNSSTDNTNGRYCGSTAPQSLETSSNMVHVTFSSDASNVAQGFSINFTEKAVACGGHITLYNWFNSTYIMSPNYPEPYPHHAECVWMIISPALTRIQVDFEGVFAIEPHPSCVYDYILFRDGGTSYSPQLGESVCGTVLPSTVVSTGSILYIRFSADSSTTRKGFKARVSVATCGGRIAGTSGVLTSPNYPSNYRGSFECEWIISVPVGHFISIRSVEFNVGTSMNCSAGDFVEIRETNSTGELVSRDCFIGRISGMRLGSVLTTADNTAYVKFRSNINNRDGGIFKFSFNASIGVCGGDLITSTGTITSPNYPRVYAHRRICRWRIMVPEGRRVTLTFDDIDLEHNENCRYDFIAVYNGVLEQSPLIRRFCGSESLEPIQSSSNTMGLLFRSDASINGRGFRVSYDSDQEAYCGGTLTDTSGNITNPGFGAQQYNHSVQCIWRISNNNPVNSSIILQFTHLHLEHGRDGCQYDSVILREGRDENSPLIKRYCGEEIPQETIYVPSPNVFVLFQTDQSVSGDGFRLLYDIKDCGGVLTQPGVVTSPNYPNDYEHNHDCVWKIVAPEGSQIRVQFTDFDLETHPACAFDYIQIFNGGLPDSPSVRKMCGTDIPSDFDSQSNMLRIVMATDHSQSRRGFRLQFTFVTEGCGGLYHSLTGNLASPNHPHSYPHDIECQWDINVPLGYIVRLRFHPPFDLEAFNCIFDYVEVFDSAPNGSLTSRGRWCSNVEPAMQLSLTSRLVVKFRTDSNTNGDGFSASWDAVCGGHFQNEAGVIYSPGFPNRYENNLNCNFTISPPVGRLIRLGFSEFELEEAGPLCMYDSVTLYEGTSSDGRQLGKFCGRTKPDALIAFNNVYINFKTDLSHTFKGFQLNYHSISCGGVLNNSRGHVVSGFYGSDYQHNMNCSWDITVDENKIVSFKFDAFKLERHSHCNFDYLAMYDGPDELSPLIGKFCGEKTTLPDLIHTTGNRLFMRFITDSSVAHDGFRGRYWSAYGPSHGCGGRLDQSSGTLTSFDANGDGLYENGLDCAWTIITEINQILSLNITEMRIENSHNCVYDSISVYDGPASSDPLLGKFCDTTPPGLLRSSGNSLLVVFHTDYSVIDRGFNATFDSMPMICGGSYNVTTQLQTIEVIGHSQPIRCSWFLASDSVLNQISINITHLHLVPSIGCQTEYLQVRDKPIGILGQVRNFCGTSLPHPFDSRGQLLQIVYHQETAGGGFQLTYQTADCNKVYRDRGSGRITSPNYPANYPSNIRCTSTVTTQVGTFLTLYFKAFNVERHTRCNFDYLRVKNSSDESVSKLCGVYLPNPIFLSDNSATLIFSTDYSATHMGYDITYVASRAGPGCGGNVTDILSGLITSPNYPSPISTNETLACTWTIRTPIRTHLLLQLLPSTMDSSSSNHACQTNYVSIMSNDRSLGRYCDPSPGNEAGAGTSAQINPTDTISVSFSSTISGRAPVFKLQWGNTP